MRHYFPHEALLDEKAVLEAIWQFAYPLKSKQELQPLHLEPDESQMSETFPFGV